MAQIVYTTVGGDTLPSVAEACGHSGEWRAILDTATWLEGLDYMAVPPGSEVLLPPDWVPAGYEAPESEASSSKLSDAAAAAEHLEERAARRSRE